MRCRLAALMLLFVLPVLYPFAAPAPERPYAILDIGPPPKGKTAEQHCKEQIGGLTGPSSLIFMAWCDPEVQKLRLAESVKKTVKGKEIHSWLAKTLQVTPEKGGRCLRLTFQAGSHAEQVVVINTLLRIYVRKCFTEAIPMSEKIIRESEEAGPRVAKLIKEEKDADTRLKYKMQREEALARDARLRDLIARLKQVAVIRWAK